MQTESTCDLTDASDRLGVEQKLLALKLIASSASARCHLSDTALQRSGQVTFCFHDQLPAHGSPVCMPVNQPTMKRTAFICHCCCADTSQRLRCPNGFC